MILTCFACNATGSIEAFTRDAEASEFVNLAGNLQPSQWQALLAYIGMFRTSRKMTFKQAAKLSREVVALDADMMRLEAALAATVESMRVKREEGTFKPFKNHRYLMAVLADTTPLPPPKLGGGGLQPVGGSRPAGKRAQALAILTDWAGGNDLIRGEIAAGLQALVALNLDNAPGADTIAYTADVWAHVLQQAGAAIPEVDAPRVREAFSCLLGKTMKRWPEPSSLKELLPRRPDRKKLPDPKPTAEQVARERQGLNEMKKTLGIK